MNDYVNYVCEILGIRVPCISYDTSKFYTDTTLAQVSPEDYVIHIKKYENINPDQLFAIAHELRHLWQSKYNYDYFFKNYKTSDILGTEKYNLQPAEIDANAFGALIMINMFGVKPLFWGLSEGVKNKIYERIEYLETFGFLI